MYPISFDNPNTAPGRDKRKPSGLPDGGNPVAANRNIAEDAPEAVGTDSEAFVGGQANSLLVVECRRDDKWRVELCTDLSELDGALDMARAFRKMPDVDEVCLTLEVSGENGRESRREVLRFTPEMGKSSQIPIQQPQEMTPVYNNEHTETMDPDVMAVLSDALKVPDYTFDGLDLDDVATSGQDQAPATPVEEDPIYISEPPQSEQRNREAARSLLASIYRDDLEAIDEDNAILVDIPEQRSGPLGHTGSPSPDTHDWPDPYDWLDSHDWLDRTEDRHMIRRSHTASHTPQRHRFEADNTLGGDNDDAIERLETPLFSRQNGMATKLLVFAGTIALLVLGGALAELLAVDLTTPANAGVGAFDTLNPLQSVTSR